MNSSELHYLLKKYNLTPNKLRGQNFLISEKVLSKIVETADLQKSDLVMEVGPGLGALTSRLIERAGQVYSFEVDKNFEIPLRQLQNISDNLHIIWQDILSLTDKQWQGIMQDNGATKYKLVANIPYYLTGKLIQKFLTGVLRPQSMTLLVQKEVAERIIVKDGKQSLLSLSVALYADCKIVTRVPAGSFYPQPKVDSSVVHIFNIAAWKRNDVDEAFVWELIHRGFSQKRKKLLNNLSSDPNLKKELILGVFEKLKLDKNIRAEKLSPQNWLDLAAALKYK